MTKFSSLAAIAVLSFSCLAEAQSRITCSSVDKKILIESTQRTSPTREGDTDLLKLIRPGKPDTYLNVHTLTLQSNASIINGLGYGTGRGILKISLGKINAANTYPKSKLIYQTEKYDLSCVLTADLLLENICSRFDDQEQLDALLIKASATGDIDLTEQAIACGADVKTKNSFGCSPLMLAVSAQGLDCQDPSDIPTLIDPLRWEKGKHIFKMLLDEGAMSSATDAKGQTIAHKVVAQSFSDLIPVLKEFSAELNELDNDGLTPLMLAAKNGLAIAVKALVEAKADKSIKNRDGKTAYDLGENLLPEARKLLSVSDADGIVIQGSDSGCSPLKISIPMSTSTKITLKAGPNAKFTMVQRNIGINLTAAPGASSEQTIRYNGMGTFKFQCGAEGGAQVTGQITITM